MPIEEVAEAIRELPDISAREIIQDAGGGICDVVSCGADEVCHLELRLRSHATLTPPGVKLQSGQIAALGGTAPDARVVFANCDYFAPEIINDDSLLLPSTSISPRFGRLSKERLFTTVPTSLAGWRALADFIVKNAGDDNFAEFDWSRRALIVLAAALDRIESQWPSAPPRWLPKDLGFAFAVWLNGGWAMRGINVNRQQGRNGTGQADRQADRCQDQGQASGPRHDANSCTAL